MKNDILKSSCCPKTISFSRSRFVFISVANGQTGQLPQITAWSGHVNRANPMTTFYRGGVSVPNFISTKFSQNVSNEV